MKRYRKSVFDNASLVFDIPKPGYLDSTTRTWVEPTPDKKKTSGDLQPFVRTGNMQVVLPEGFKTDSSWMYITDANLPTIDDIGGSFAAKTLIKGKEYYVAIKYDFSCGLMTTDTNFYILALKKIPDGT